MTFYSVFMEKKARGMPKAAEKPAVLSTWSSEAAWNISKAGLMPYLDENGFDLDELYACLGQPEEENPTAHPLALTRPLDKTSRHCPRRQ